MGKDSHWTKGTLTSITSESVQLTRYEETGEVLQSHYSKDIINGIAEVPRTKEQIAESLEKLLYE